jgi:hypothetical protein
MKQLVSKARPIVASAVTANAYSKNAGYRARTIDISEKAYNAYVSAL